MKLYKMLGAVALGATLLGGAHSVKAQAATATGADVLPTTGTKELSLAGNYDLNGAKAYNLLVGLGFFISPAIEVGGQVGVSGYSGSGSSTTTSVGATADYYFTGLGGNGTSTSALLPFVGIFLGYTNSSGNSGSGNTSSYGAQAGVKYFLNPNVSVNGFYQYLKFNNSNSFGQSNDSSLNLGLSTYFH